jgi:hypothetical protein
MRTNARETRETIGALQEANTTLIVEAALLGDALTQNTEALSAALDHITTVEKENDQLRAVVRSLTLPKR